MNDDVRADLDIAPDASSRDRTIDITTYGARTGMPRRIETWLHHVDGRWFLTGQPGRRNWYANLQKNPRLIVHLKHDVHADVPATALPITAPEDKRNLLAMILRGLEDMRGASASLNSLDAWTAGSPLVEILFEVEESNTD